VLEFLARDTRPLHASRRARRPLPVEVDPGEVGEGPAGADELCPAPVAQRERPANVVAHVLAKLAHGLATGREAEELLGHADGAEGERDEAIEQPVGAHRQLQRSAADVHHHRPAAREVEVGERRAKGEARLVIAVQDAHAQPGLTPHEFDELLAVGGVAHGAGGDRFDLGRAVLRG